MSRKPRWHLKDEFGIWHYSGSHPQAFYIKQEDDGYISIERHEVGATGKNVMLLRRLHCTHPSNAEFKRLICFLSGMLNYLIIGMYLVAMYHNMGNI